MKTIKGICLGLGIVALCLSPMFYFVAWHYQTEFELYTNKGQEQEARIVDKIEQKGGKSTSYYVKISYFDKSILDGGEFYMPEVEVNAKVFKKVAKDDKVKILILPQKPDKPILELSTKAENFVPFEQYESAYFLVFLGLGLLGIAFLLDWKEKKS